jgi:hypothetical protein
MTTKEQIEALTGPKDYTLTEDEYWAVYDWIDAVKDTLPSPRKEGLLKLLNGEGWRRM